MAKLVEELKDEFDYIILDCPAGIEQGFKNVIAAADRALIVTTPEVSAIRDADRIIGLLEANDIHKIDLVINRIRMDMVERGDMLSKDDVLDILAVDLIGIVPDDENIVISTNQGEPLVGSNTPAGKAYKNICDRVMGKESHLWKLQHQLSSRDLHMYLKSRGGDKRWVFLIIFLRKRVLGKVAKDRLKLLLVSDRSNCSPETMELMKNDIIKESPNIWRSTRTDRTFRLHKTARNQKDRHYMPIFRFASLENNIGERTCCEIIDCKITISNSYLMYLY